MNTANTSVLEMLQAGVHFGHKTSKRHPKMMPFIFGAKHGISIIDLERTVEQLNKILPVIEDLAAHDKKILFLGTKQQAQALVKTAAEQVNMPYIVERWIGGLLTNFQHVSRLMRKLTQLKAGRDSGEWNDRYTKKERLEFEREIETLEHLIGGIETMATLPDLLFVVDCKKERTAIQEANRLKISVMAITDTNVDPSLVKYPIPGNDDGIKSISYIVNQVMAAIQRGQARKVETPTVPTVKA